MSTSKKLFVAMLAATSLSFSSLQAQNCVVQIPDANFKQYLLSLPTVNSNGDGEIQCTEASSFTGTLSPVSKQINDLTGIEAFVNILGLECDYNNLTTLNVASNLNLGQLSCNGNQLSELNVSGHSSLRLLDCMQNQLTSLQLPASGSLTYLRCYNNQLSVLDVHAQTGLVTLACSNNLLTGLNVSTVRALKYFGCDHNLLESLNMQNGYNTQLIAFDATFNPDLKCVQVDNVVYSQTNWAGKVDGSVSFSTNCGGTTPGGGNQDCSQFTCGNNNEKVQICHLSSDKKVKSQTLCVDKNALDAHLEHGDKCGPCSANRIANPGYVEQDAFVLTNQPNPFYGSTTIRFELPMNDKVKLEVFDITGKLIQTVFEGNVEEHQVNEVQFSARQLPNGLYFCKLSTGDQFIVSKMILMQQ